MPALSQTPEESGLRIQDAYDVSKGFGNFTANQSMVLRNRPGQESQRQLRTHRVDYYDRKDNQMKTLEFRDYHQYEDEFWQARTFEMVNHVTGKGTILTWSDFVFGGNVNEKEFTQTGLRRIR